MKKIEIKIKKIIEKSQNGNSAKKKVAKKGKAENRRAQRKYSK